MKVRRCVTLALASSLLFAGGVSGASAETSDEPNPRVDDSVPADGSMEIEMSVVGIDRQQARKAGNRVVVRDGYDVLIDGATNEELARVPRDKNRGRLSGPQEGPVVQGTVYGKCGSSYIDIWDDSTRGWGRFSTGFNLVGEAYDFDWYIHIYSHNGRENDYWEDHGPMWASPGWTSGNRGFSTAASGDLHDAYVRSGAAYLTDGRVCYANKPADWYIRIY